MNIGDIPAKWACLDPERPALVDIPTGRRVSFGELEQAVRRLANGLLGLGMAKGDRVAVLARNGIEYFEVYYACARAGLIAQPLNWRLSAPELKRILEDGEPSALVTSADFEAERQALAAEVEIPHWLQFGPGSDASFARLKASAPDANPKVAAGGDDPVLILYTGGTTGLSKGALHSHRTLFMGMLNQTVAERVVPSDVYMLTGQMFHIPVALAMNYMAHGCPVVLMNFDATEALEIIEAERVSAFLGITTMLNWMMAVDGFHRYDLSSLRNIQYGGGPLPETVVKAALDAFPCTLIPGYGQTEGMTMPLLSQEDNAAAVSGSRPQRLNSCGREGFVTRARVVDETGRAVPKDGRTPGEIVIQSEANMLGYWRRPDLTADTLRNGRMWTGDVATWDEDGYIFIVDRAKDMIISGGVNIYPQEIENVLITHPKVADVAVFGVPNEEFGEEVKAVVQPASMAHATDDIAEDLIAYARQSLSSIKTPSSIDFEESLPRHATGKLYKRLLKDRYRGKTGNRIV